MWELGNFGPGASWEAAQKARFDWCGAFVHFCCEQAGIEVPIQPEGLGTTTALVASWAHWAKQKGYWHPARSTKPRRGDIVTFDWPGRNRFDHIGVVRGYTPGSSKFNTAEGNTDNRTAQKTRSLSQIAGIIRIR